MFGANSVKKKNSKMAPFFRKFEFGAFFRKFGFGAFFRKFEAVATTYH